jgi:hypothetical protein
MRNFHHAMSYKPLFNPMVNSTVNSEWELKHFGECDKKYPTKNVSTVMTWKYSDYIIRLEIIYFCKAVGPSKGKLVDNST